MHIFLNMLRLHPIHKCICNHHRWHLLICTVSRWLSQTLWLTICLQLFILLFKSNAYKLITFASYASMLWGSTSNLKLNHTNTKMHRNSRNKSTKSPSKILSFFPKISSFRVGKEFWNDGTVVTLNNTNCLSNAFSTSIEVIPPYMTVFIVCSIRT